MIESIRFENFKLLRNTTLLLGRFTLLVGPNGSGKSSVFQALLAIQGQHGPFHRFVSAGLEAPSRQVQVELGLQIHGQRYRHMTKWYANGRRATEVCDAEKTVHKLSNNNPAFEALHQKLMRLRVFSLNAAQIAAATELQPKMELKPDGGGLPGVLDRLRDEAPERFEELNAQLALWLPEFDRVLFNTAGPGVRAFSLRTRAGQHSIPAEELSQGTLCALAILALAYLPEPPPVVCLEEPDRGIHPRLLRDVKDALYRLAYPEIAGERREPVQVITTTHSPYFLDLFRERLEEVVIAERHDDGVQFKRLSEMEHVEDILGDAQLGDAWYTGVLGGVPLES